MWKSKNVEPQPNPKPLPKSPAQSLKSPDPSKKRIHPSLPIYSEDGLITCGKQLGHLFWIIVLMEQGGFLIDSLEIVSRNKRLTVAKNAIEIQESLKLDKESLAHFETCIRTLMTDDRIPVWNPLCMKLLVATSSINMVKQTDTQFEIIAPWKQRRECILVRETVGKREWTIETLSDSELKSRYPMKEWVPSTKTARSKMSRDELYLVCSMWDIHPPKMTKKCMLELISVKLMK